MFEQFRRMTFKLRGLKGRLHSPCWQYVSNCAIDCLFKKINYHAFIFLNMIQIGGLIGRSGGGQLALIASLECGRTLIW